MAKEKEQEKKITLEFTKQELIDEFNALLRDEELNLLFRQQKKYEKFVQLSSILEKIDKKE